jgi:hypothetical protein
LAGWSNKRKLHNNASRHGLVSHQHHTMPICHSNSNSQTEQLYYRTHPVAKPPSDGHTLIREHSSAPRLLMEPYHHNVHLTAKCKPNWMVIWSG